MPFAKTATVLAALGAALVLLSAGVCAVRGVGNYGAEGLIFLIPGIVLLVLAAAAGVTAALAARGVLTPKGARFAFAAVATFLGLLALGATSGQSLFPGQGAAGLWIYGAAGAVVIAVVAYAAEKAGSRGAFRGALVGIGIGLVAPLLAAALFWAFVLLFQALYRPFR